MKSCARFPNGAPGLNRNGREVLRRDHGSHGFTLLEMCMVLFIMALLMGLSLPAIQSTFVEQGVRNDATQLSLMVKTAMLKSADQHRPYVIDFTKQTMTLHPAPDAVSNADNDDAKTGVSEDDVITTVLDSSNKLLFPDPDKANKWLPIKSAAWFFKPGELCSVPRVRFVRDTGWLEMSFNALTGNVENETAYFP